MKKNIIITILIFIFLLNVPCFVNISAQTIINASFGTSINGAPGNTGWTSTTTGTSTVIFGSALNHTQALVHTITGNGTVSTKQTVLFSQGGTYDIGCKVARNNSAITPSMTLTFSSKTITIPPGTTIPSVFTNDYIGRFVYIPAGTSVTIELKSTRTSGSTAYTAAYDELYADFYSPDQLVDDAGNIINQNKIQIKITDAFIRANGFITDQNVPAQNQVVSDALVAKIKIYADLGRTTTADKTQWSSAAANSYTQAAAIFRGSYNANGYDGDQRIHIWEINNTSLGATFFENNRDYRWKPYIQYNGGTIIPINDINDASLTGTTNGNNLLINGRFEAPVATPTDHANGWNIQTTGTFIWDNTLQCFKSVYSSSTDRGKAYDFYQDVQVVAGETYQVALKYASDGDNFVLVADGCGIYETEGIDAYDDGVFESLRFTPLTSGTMRIAVRGAGTGKTIVNNSATPGSPFVRIYTMEMFKTKSTGGVHIFSNPSVYGTWKGGLNGFTNAMLAGSVYCSISSTGIITVPATSIVDVHNTYTIPFVGHNLTLDYINFVVPAPVVKRTLIQFDQYESVKNNLLYYLFCDDARVKTQDQVFPINPNTGQNDYTTSGLKYTTCYYYTYDTNVEQLGFTGNLKQSRYQIDIIPWFNSNKPGDYKYYISQLRPDGWMSDPLEITVRILPKTLDNPSWQSIYFFDYDEFIIKNPAELTLNNNLVPAYSYDIYGSTNRNSENTPGLLSKPRIGDLNEYYMRQNKITIGPSYKYMRGDSIGSDVKAYYPNDGSFTIGSGAGQSSAHWGWALKDHTSLSNSSTANQMMIINADQNGTGVLYQQPIKVCPDSRIRFSGWFLNVNQNINLPYRIKPNIKINIYKYDRVNDKIVAANGIDKIDRNSTNAAAKTAAIVVSKITGELPMDKTWWWYFIDFNTGAMNDVLVEFQMLTIGGGGNDFAIDDIRVERAAKALSVNEPEFNCLRDVTGPDGAIYKKAVTMTGQFLPQMSGSVDIGYKANDTICFYLDVDRQTATNLTFSDAYKEMINNISSPVRLHNPTLDLKVSNAIDYATVQANIQSKVSAHTGTSAALNDTIRNYAASVLKQAGNAGKILFVPFYTGSPGSFTEANRYAVAIISADRNVKLEVMGVSETDLLGFYRFKVAESANLLQSGECLDSYVYALRHVQVTVLTATQFAACEGDIVPLYANVDGSPNETLYSWYAEEDLNGDGTKEIEHIGNGKRVSLICSSLDSEVKYTVYINGCPSYKAEVTLKVDKLPLFQFADPN